MRVTTLLVLTLAGRIAASGTTPPACPEEQLQIGARIAPGD